MRSYTWILIVSLLLTAVAMPALSSAQSGDLQVTVSESTIFIGDSLTIEALYSPEIVENASVNVSAYHVDVFIYDLQSGERVWKTNGSMSAGGNFTCVFTTNRSTEFGHYTIYLRVQNVTKSIDFSVSPSLLDIWMDNQEQKKLNEERAAKEDWALNWYLPWATALALFVGYLVIFRTRVKEGKLADLWDGIFTFRKERAIKKAVKDYRDPDRSKYRRHHDKPTAVRAQEINDIEDNKRHAMALYNRKMSRAHKKAQEALELVTWSQEWKKKAVMPIERELLKKQRIQKETKEKFLEDAKKENRRVIEKEPEEKDEEKEAAK